MEAFLREQRAGGGAYRELRPATDLAPLLACGWVRVVRHGTDPQPVPVIPDGCADIITCNDGPPILVGPDTQARLFEIDDGTVITGIRLRPGALRAVLGCPAGELLDTSVPLDALASTGRQLYAELHGADTLVERLALLEQWVRGELHEGTRDRALIHACRTLAAQPHTDVGDVAAELGWSVRMIHREFVAACGYGPKTMQRIMRVQHVMRIVHRARRPVRLGEVAASSGFADQAHMTREFRALTGATPTRYLAVSEPGVGQWLDADLPDAP